MRSSFAPAALVLLVVAVVAPGAALAQSPVGIGATKPPRALAVRPVPLRAGRSNESYRPIPAPGHALGTNGSVNSLQQTSTIQVSYHGFSAQAQAAFQAAVNVWQSIVVSDQVIHVDASWTNLGSSSGILGQAGPKAIYLGNDNFWYPGPLYEARCDCAMNSFTEPDITADFNSAFGSWYLGTDGNVPSGKWDLETVVMHELGHGLGFIGSFDVIAGKGYWGWRAAGVNHPLRFDANQWSAATGGTQLITYPGVNGSQPLRDELTDGSVFLGGTNIVAALNGRARLYAPSSWSGGSSNSHLDEQAYQPGTINALMTPVLNNGESIHDPGPAVNAIFKDIGWTLAGATTAPSAPLNVAATAGDASAAVSWSAPTSNGGSVITGYTATSAPGALTCATTGATSCSVTGLTNGISYTFTVTATNSVGTGPASAPSAAVVPHVASGDLVAPTVASPSVGIVAAQTVRTAMFVDVSWPAATDSSGIASYELQRQPGAGAWTNVPLANPTQTSVQVSVTRGANVSFRVRATDGAGNVGAWATLTSRHLTIYQEKSALVAFASAWARAALSGASGGYVDRSSTATDTATFTFSGTSVGFVSTRAKGRGIATITLDGTLVATLDLYSASKVTKTVVWVPSAPLAAGSHTLVVAVTGTHSGAATSSRVDVDAFLVWP